MDRNLVAMLSVVFHAAAAAACSCVWFAQRARVCVLLSCALTLIRHRRMRRERRRQRMHLSSNKNKFQSNQLMKTASCCSAASINHTGALRPYRPAPSPTKSMLPYLVAAAETWLLSARRPHPDTPRDMAGRVHRRGTLRRCSRSCSWRSGPGACPSCPR